MSPPRTGTVARGVMPSTRRRFVAELGTLFCGGLAALALWAVFAPAAHAFEWCPDGSYCLDGYACCPNPYNPPYYWC